MEESRKVPRGKSRAYQAAALLARRRFAKMSKTELREHQRKAALARWAKQRQRELEAEDEET